ncbi:porin family protein [Rufibacter roseus]|uniref:Porin family protein n=1 Tax=Rufibacter roseus TaxID=1567108 RepID=A0ABW2DT44_9BACT|nr:porin family protein [Rufibacter roseus]
MKHLLLLLVFKLCSFAGYSQEEPFFDSSWAIYGRAGVNSAGTRGWYPGQAELKRTVGFNVGVGYSQAINFREDTWVNAEASFSQQGFKFTNVAAPEDPESVSLNYLNIPVFVRYFPFPNMRNVYVGGGAQIGIRLDGRITARNGTMYRINENDFPRTDWSGIGVAGIHFAKRTDLGLEVRYQHGLTSISREVAGVKQSVIQVDLFFPGSFLMDILSIGVFL